MSERHTEPDERSGSDHIQLDAIAEDIGEDPGRFLDVERITSPGRAIKGERSPLPRIRGLASIKIVRAYRAAERKIARIRNREPRERILAALDHREAYLESYQPDPDFERDVPEKEVLYRTEDGDLVPYDEVDRTGALEGLGDSAPVATGGGEQSDA